MVRPELKNIDVTNIPELLQIAEQVKTSGEPRMLKRDDEDLAMLIPAKPKARARRTPTRADHEAFLAAAGSWKDLIDAEAFKTEVRASRGSDRPTVTL